MFRLIVNEEKKKRLMVSANSKHTSKHLFGLVGTSGAEGDIQTDHQSIRQTDKRRDNDSDFSAHFG